VGAGREERRRQKAALAEEKRAAKEARRERGEGRARAKAAGGVLVSALQGDPEVLARAVELGLVRQEWLDDPTGQHVSDAKATDVLERMLERRVEQHPSTLAELGLTALQLLASGRDGQGDEGSPQVLTVVFSDLEDFTAYTANEGDQAASRLLVEHQRAIGPIVRSRGGRIVKHLGDGVLLTFPSCEAAVLAGLELVDAHREPLRLRVGLHVGEVLVTRQQDLVGHVVNVAARVTDLAQGGEMLTTADVRDAVAGLPGVTFEDRGPVQLKGIDSPVAVCEARSANP
jgi:class 3 adenylate cyclase